MRLSDYLRIPYIIAVSSEERDDGEWLRVAECPELPACRAESQSILDAMDLLSRRRIEVLVELLGRGQAPPVPRPPLRSFDVKQELQELGLLGELEDLLDRDERELPGHADGRRR